MDGSANHFNSIGIGGDLDMPRIRHLLKLGIVSAAVVLIGDMLLGYGSAAYTSPAARRFIL